jgi:hypothetical protein
MKKRGLTTFLALIPFAIASCFAISSCHGTQFVHPYDITELGVTNRTYIKQTSTTKYDYATLLHGTKKYHSGNYLLITAISAPDSTGNCKFNNFLFSAGPSPFTNDSNPQFSNSVGVGIVDFYTRLDNDPNDSGLTNLGIALYYEFDRIVDDYKIKDGTAATPFAK